MPRKTRQDFRPDFFEQERWTIVGPCKDMEGWTRKVEYSFTDRGIYSRITLTSKEGKSHRYQWSRTSVSKESIEKRNPKVVKRRKGGKKVSFK